MIVATLDRSGQAGADLQEVGVPRDKQFPLRKEPERRPGAPAPTPGRSRTINGKLPEASSFHGFLPTSAFSSPAAPASSARTSSLNSSTPTRWWSTTTCTATRCSSRTSRAQAPALHQGRRARLRRRAQGHRRLHGGDPCAAIAGVYTVDRSAVRTMEVNLLGTHQVVKAAIEVGVERFVEFSTSEVYGSFIHKGKEDDFTPIGPIGESRWVYAASKLASEHLSYAHYREDKLPLAIVRPFNVYGPRQVGDGAIRGMTLQALKDLPITLYNDGTQIRSWCFVSDFVDGVLRCCENPARSATPSTSAIRRARRPTSSSPT
jgi:hypothetical protein